MRLNRTQRLRIAHEIRRQLSWAHIIVGAIGHNFIEISRGECIKGTHSSGSKVGYTGSAWSRAWPGSYCLHVNFSGPWMECRRHMEPRPGESERMVGTNRVLIPPMKRRMPPADRIKAVADFVVTHAVMWLPEARRDNELLREHERFDVKVNELDPVLNVVRL